MESGGGYMSPRRSTLRLNPLAQFLPSSPGPLPLSIPRGSLGVPTALAIQWLLATQPRNGPLAEIKLKYLNQNLTDGLNQVIVRKNP
jgi:hypothetical protein